MDLGKILAPQEGTFIDGASRRTVIALSSRKSLERGGHSPVRLTPPVKVPKFKTFKEMQICSKCKKNREDEEFYAFKLAKSGLSSWCKDCAREYSKRHDKRPEVMERKRKYQNDYHKRPENRKKYLATQTLNNYVRVGLVKKSAYCESVRSEFQCSGRIEAHHHEGYDKPLSVIWLCKKHHEATHH